MATALVVYVLLGAVALYGVVSVVVEYVRQVARHRNTERSGATNAVVVQPSSRKRGHAPPRHAVCALVARMSAPSLMRGHDAGTVRPEPPLPPPDRT